jgi:hypothetical protein
VPIFFFHKLNSQTVSREKRCKTLLYIKAVGKLLVKWTPGVNFINVLRSTFSYERRFSSYFLALLKNLYEKCARVTLMKLTAVMAFALETANREIRISFGFWRAFACIPFIFDTFVSRIEEEVVKGEGEKLR